ncbi:MAG: hypothetical protein ACM3X9_03125 [Bacillota bacterium]
MNVNSKEKVLFIDIDGVLFGEYDGYYQLRPGVSSFFAWAAPVFRCEFLTCWSWPRVQTLLESLYIDRRSLRIGYRQWRNLKTDGINPERDDFYIIDDNLIQDEIAQLEKWGLRGRYLQVAKQGEHQLYQVKRSLIELEGLREE